LYRAPISCLSQANQERRDVNVMALKSCFNLQGDVRRLWPIG